MQKITSKKNFSCFFKIFLTIVFIFFVNRSLTRYEFNNIAGNVSAPYLLIALLLSFIGLYCQVKRWEIILLYQNFPIKRHVAFKTILWGTYLAFITPGRFGEILRGLKITDSRKRDSVFAVIIDKLFIIITVLVAGLICIISQILFLGTGITKEVKIFLFVAFAICTIGFVVLFSGKIFDKHHVVSQYFKKILINLPRLFTPSGKKALIYSFIAHICLISQTVILLIMFGCGTIVKNCLAVGQAYAVMPFFPFFIGNMGIREGCFIFFLTHIGAESNTVTFSIAGASLGTSIIILIMNLIFPAFIGLLWFLLESFIKKTVI